MLLMLKMLPGKVHTSSMLLQDGTLSSPQMMKWELNFKPPCTELRAEWIPSKRWLNSGHSALVCSRLLSKLRTICDAAKLCGAKGKQNILIKIITSDFDKLYASFKFTFTFVLYCQILTLCSSGKGVAFLYGPCLTLPTILSWF